VYSPFYDKQGTPLDISQIKYTHLQQLVDCEEGHHLEYKLKLEDGGKNQIAKEITSFANCEGGWLIVGIEDKTKQIEPISKLDYSQKVGKIVSRVSPMPEFETRFISMPNDKMKGILLIYVYEGKKAPYVCDGSIYVRCGSNKEPIKPADRGNVEYLIKRSTSYEQELNEFFKRDYFFSYSNLLMRKVTYPIVAVYLKNISPNKDNRLNKFANRNKLISFVKKKWPVFEQYQFSMNSIIFTHKQVYSGNNSGTMVFEMFYDWSCKIYLPLGNYDSEEIGEIKLFYESLGIEKEVVDKFQLINAGTVCNALMCCLMVFKGIAEKYGLKEHNYAFCTEIENAGQTVMCFSGDKYKEYVNKYGIPYAAKEVNKSEIFYLKDYKKVKFSTLISSIINDFVGPAYGFESDVIWEILDDDNMKYGLEN